VRPAASRRIAFQKNSRRAFRGAKEFIQCNAASPAMGISAHHAGGTMMKRSAGQRRDAQDRYRLPGGNHAERAARHQFIAGSRTLCSEAKA